VINKIAHIQQLILLFLFLIVTLHYRPRYNAYPTFFRQVLILLQIPRTLLDTAQKLGIIGLPVGEVVFRENGELGALGGGGADERTCFLEVVLGL
jgi:hypothetical protein